MCDRQRVSRDPNSTRHLMVVRGTDAGALSAAMTRGACLNSVRWVRQEYWAGLEARMGFRCPCQNQRELQLRLASRREPPADRTEGDANER